MADSGTYYVRLFTQKEKQSFDKAQKPLFDCYYLSGKPLLYIKAAVEHLPSTQYREATPDEIANGMYTGWLTGLIEPTEE